MAGLCPPVCISYASAQNKGETQVFDVGCCSFRVQLAKEGALNLKQIRFFVLDECDKMLEKLGKQHDVHVL